MGKRTTVLVALLAFAAIEVQDEKQVEKTGSVSGKVKLAIEKVKFKDIGPVVAYLEAIKGKLRYKVPKEIPIIYQKDAKFVPNFLIVTAGQSVSMPNKDSILHNVFSYSEGNKFDLGLYKKGEAKSVTLKNPGVVHIHCSIHKSMNATIFVSPSPYYASVDSMGIFKISDVPPGEYRLVIWNKMLPEVRREVEIIKEKDTNVELVLKAKKKK